MSLLRNDVRRAIVRLLGDRELSAGEIAEALGRPRPGISHHLVTLIDGGVLLCRPVGSFRYYRVDPSRAFPAWDDVLEFSFGTARRFSAA